MIITWFIVYAFVIIMPLIVSVFLLRRYPGLGQHTRTYMVILMLGLSFVVLELSAFIASFLPSYFWFYLVQFKIYAVFLSIPFYYWATRYWTEVASGTGSRLRFFGIQFLGLTFGFSAGFMVFFRWTHVSSLFAYSTSPTGWIRYMIPQFF